MRRGTRCGQIFCSGLVMMAVALPCGAQQWSGYVPAPDGVLLATDVYLPIGPGPWPVVLTRTPYDKQDPGHYDIWCQTLVQHGYACVAQDCRGRFDSGGTDTVFRDGGRDGHATLEWIADQSWCNGSIASVGGSAMGLTGYAMAPAAPPELKCMVAAVATPDIYEHIFSHGGSVRWELAYNWLAGQGSLDLYDEFLDHRLRDEWWRDYHWLSSPDTVNVKTLHFGGWWDLYIQGPIDAYREYHHQGGEGAVGNQYLVMGPWHHFTLNADWLAQTFPGDRVTGELRFPDNAFPGGWPFADNGWQMLLDWLGYCLQDEQTAAASWPQAQVYLMGAVGESDAPGNRWLGLNEWPPRTVSVPYYLTAQGGLTRTAPGDSQLILEIDPEDPVPTLGGANHFGDLEVNGRPMGIGPFDQRSVEARDDVLTFTSPVLDESVTVMGRVRCRLWVRPDSPDMDLSVRLTDVYPDGRSMHVLDGVQRARMRCGDDRECLLVPGEPTEIEVDLWSTAIVFNAGHQIRVAIAGSNWPRFEVNPNDGGDLRTGTPMVVHPILLFGDQNPSALHLPVVPPPRKPLGRQRP
jgi:predicted acyl esterase